MRGRLVATDVSAVTLSAGLLGIGGGPVGATRDREGPRAAGAVPLDADFLAGAIRGQLR